jgi:hypothetical protein
MAILKQKIACFYFKSQSASNSDASLPNAVIGGTRYLAHP